MNIESVTAIRVMHIISAPAAGGAEIYVKDLAISTSRAGHEVFVLFLESALEAGRDLRFEKQFLTELRQAGVLFSVLGRQCRRNPLLGILKVREHARSWRPDIIHAHLYFGAIFASFAASNLVYTHHSSRLRVSRYFYRWFLDRRVKAYIGICHLCTQMLRRVSKGLVTQIDNGVDPARLVLRASSRPNDLVQVLSVGRLIPEKNYELLLSALSLLTDVPFEAVIAGEGPERDRLVECSQRLGLGHKVRFLGNVPDIPGLLAQADIFAMSSRSEGLPIALVEATLSGLPVVVTNVGGCAEVVHKTCNGIVVETLDADAFARALRALLESPALRERLSLNALENSKCYELDVAVQAHLQLYLSICKSARTTLGAL